MINLNTSMPHSHASTVSAEIHTNRRDSNIAVHASVAQNSANATQISESAKLLSSLYATANEYVKDEHLPAFTGPVQGNMPPSGYVNVGKYNDYLFDKAASTMIAAAKDSGISLDKADVVAQLKSDNAEIASIKLDNASRVHKLGSGSVMADLTLSDLDNLTETYIAAKEHGLDLAEVGGLALRRGIQNHYGSTLQAADVFPYDWDFAETDPEKIAAAKNIMPESITLKAEELRGKLQGDLGLGSDFIEFLLNPRIGLRSATDASLTFLSRLADIHSQQK